MNEQLRGCTNEAHNHTGIEAAQRASHVLEEQINNKSDFNDDEALHLGYEYVQRWFEIIFFCRDSEYESMHSRGESGPEPVTDNLVRYLESALFSAQGGDYIQLKNVLVFQGNRLTRIPVQRKILGQNLIKIGRSIPTKGKPFNPLIPAWKDPRFNGEQELVALTRDTIV